MKVVTRIIASLLLISSQALASDVLNVRINVTDIKSDKDLSSDSPSQLVDEVNKIWDTCSIRFILTSEKDVEENAIREIDSPKSQDDLGKIVKQFTVKNSIPLVFLSWDFFDSVTNLYLYGLGWAFYYPTSIDRLGAIINKNSKHKSSNYISVIAHELGHALSLSHTDKDDIMGSGSLKIRQEQCAQTREFITTKMSLFIVH